jgi:hypothetical protein
MAARSVQTTGAAVAQVVAVGVAFTLSSVLLTVNVAATAWIGASTHKKATSGAQRIPRRRVSLLDVTAGAPSSLEKPPRSLPSPEPDA